MVPALRVLAQSAEGNMYGNQEDFEEMAFVDQWVEFISQDIQKTADELVYSILGRIGPITKKDFNIMKKVV